MKRLAVALVGLLVVSAAAAASTGRELRFGDIEPAQLTFRPPANEYAVLGSSGHDQYQDPTDFTLTFLNGAGRVVAGPRSVGPQPRPAGARLSDAIDAYDTRDDSYLLAAEVGSDIELQPLNGDGSRSAPATRLTDMPQGMSATAQRLAFDARHDTYLLLFATGPSSGPPGVQTRCSMFAQQLARSGTPLGAAHTVQGGFSCNDLGSQGSLPYDDLAGSFLYLWADSGNRIFARRLSASGRLTGRTSALAPRTRRRPLGVRWVESITFDDRARRFVLLGARGTDGRRLVVEQLGSSGRLLAAGAQLDAPADATDIAGTIAYAHGQLILGVSTVTGGGADTIGTDHMTIRRLAANSTRLLGGPLPLGSGPAVADPFGNEPFLVYNTSARAFLALWLTTGGVRGRLVR